MATPSRDGVPLPAPVALGPFLLESRLGCGGMGEVWRARHAAQELAVAVKVMTGSQARSAAYRSLFRNEVQAMAGLDHAGIVMVLDAGEAGRDAEAASEGAVPAGSPYLVMELAEGGTLRDLAAPLGWRRLKAVLLALLDALGHAHARGVIHRDLKASNVLVCRPAAPELGVKLADFGLAFALDAAPHSPDAEEVSGTPHYMSPEQVLGAWREFGPWSDLYALGCVVHELVCGAPPFPGRELAEVTRAQLREPLPRLAPRMSVPAWFEGWLHRLLHKDPAQRFRAAAEAAWALDRLGDVAEDERFLPTVEERATDPDLRPGAVDPHELPTSRLLRAPHPSPAWERAADGVELCPRQSPPLPPSWERGGAPAAALRIPGAGLGLYGLRSIPLVGRRAECDALWSAVLESRESGRARVVVLAGTAGTGKTRLVEWIAERCHELAGAVSLKAVCGETRSPGHGLARMMARHLGCVGLTRAQAAERIERQLRAEGVEDDREWLGLTDLICPAAAGEGPAALLSPNERHGLVRRALARAGQERAVIAVLDDVHWSLDALDFAEHVLALQPRAPTPALLVLTVREEALCERPDEAEQIERLLRLPGARRVELQPLAPRDRAALVKGLLGLEGELARDVEERSGGNPLFAVQLVGDWVQRGVLEPRASGFALKAGERAVLPDGLHEIWTVRVEQLLAGQPPQARVALELAAALGLVVDRREWEAACGELGLDALPGLVDALAAGRLARREEGGWSFVHPMLRESLERLAREAGRWPALSRACAAMLQPQWTAGRRGAAARLGRHLLEAADPEGAVEPLLQGARELRETSDYREAHDLLLRREEALAAAGIPGDDPRWGTGWVLRARIFLHEAQLEDVDLWAERACRQAGREGWTDIRSEALRLLGDAARRRGDLERAARLYRECVALRGEATNPHGVAGSLWGLGDVARQRGETDAALAMLEQSRLLYETIGDRHGIADHGIGAADVAWQRRELAAAGRLYGEALALFEALGNRYGAARSLNGLGEVARAEGQLSRAEELYRRSLSLLEVIRSAEALFPRVNLGLAALTAGRVDDARAWLAPALAEMEPMAWRGAAACAEAALLACDVHEGDWAAWSRRWPRVARLAASDAADCDLAWCLELAGEWAAAAGQPPRSRPAYELALAQWKRLGHADRASWVQAALERLAAG